MDLLRVFLGRIDYSQMRIDITVSYFILMSSRKWIPEVLFPPNDRFARRIGKFLTKLIVFVGALLFFAHRH
jgi:hypothetical protein